MRISTPLRSGMLSNYFKTAVRNLAKNKLFATINIFALAMGMSISLIFIATLLFVFRYDNFHPNKERIYRVITHVRDNQNNPSFCSTPVGLAQLLQQDVAGLEKVVRINGSMYLNAVPASDKSMVGAHGSSRIPIEGYFADPEFLTMFNFPLAQGDPSSALVKPNSIVLTREAAIKIFGTKDPLGEIITMEPSGEFMVTGVFEEVPYNSHMNFEAVVSYATLLADNGTAFIEREENWTHFVNSYVYFLVSDNTTRDGIQQYLDRVASKKYTTPDYKATFELQRLDKIVPGPMLYNSIGPSWDYLSMTLVGLLTMIILIPACANYVTLAISQSLRRMKEIGVRKVMGGLKKQIFMQFVIETGITMLLALILAYIFFELMRGEALEYIGDKIDLNPTPLTYLGFIGFALFVGFVAGIVPALYFAKIAPLAALKGKEAKSGRRGGFPFRKIVITTQFILSLFFIMAVTIVLSQYHYSTNYNLGFEQQNILDIELQNTDPQLLKNEFGKLASVQAISMSAHPLGTGFSQGYVKTINYPALSAGKQDSVETFSISIDENFISLMKLELLRGNNFTDNHFANKGFIIANEEFAKALSPEDPSGAIGQVVKLPEGREVSIGGIVKNFHYDNLKSPIKSFYFEYNPQYFHFANIKIQSANIAADQKRMETAWKKINATDPFLAQFLTDEIGNAYKFYFEVIKLWSFLGVMAITVSCLGLLGTVVFTIRTRVKEISLRKVMGASSENLVMLLSKDFVILMVIASIITVPAVWIILGQMLTHMQYYSVQIGFPEIAISIFILFFVGLATVLSQTLKAANMNPVDNLRVE